MPIDNGMILPLERFHGKSHMRNGTAQGQVQILDDSDGTPVTAQRFGGLIPYEGLF
jgi:hypothetical protein